MQVLTTTTKPQLSEDTGQRQRSVAYIPALDGIRGLAMIFVLVCHWSQSVITIPIHGYVKDIALPMVFIGQTGLDIFFVLSGFLITRILIVAKGKPWGIANFLVRRGLKIFPLYYLVLMVVLLLTPADFRHNQLRMNANDVKVEWLWFYGQNFANYFHHTWLFGALDHFWSLAVEEHFYWLWPLAVVFLCRRNMAAMAVGLIAVSIGSRAWFQLGFHDGFACEMLTFCRLDGLACGALLAVTESAGLLNRKLTGWLVALFVTCLAAAIGVHHDLFGDYGLVLLKTFESFTFVAAIAMVIIYKDSWLGRVFSHPVLTFFGLYSYGIYTYHHIFRPPLVPVTLFFDIHKPNDAAISFGALNLALSLSLALVSYHLYEKHFLKLKSRFPSAPVVKEKTVEPEKALSHS